ncbi:MAG: hypothetical protein GKS00_15660 [Alphaproteobacteria bacterium]|nr:hypothetical protein [Alphaproteobacteria bacterium]
MRIGIFAVSSVLAAVGFLGAAAAAPQVLMVVTPTDELPLTCENGLCSTEVAAICLQPDRGNPARGKNYSVRESDANIRGARSTRVEDTMTLVGTDAAGHEKILPATNTLRIKAERDHFAVTLSVDEAVMRQNGLTSLAVRVTGNVLLFPEADKNDPNPQTASDIEVAKTMQRGTAKRILSKRSDKVVGASVVQVAMNALPRDRATNEDERVSARDAALSKTVSKTALSHAKEAFYACRSVSDHAIIKRYDSRYSYRACLGIMHDDLIDGVNKEYWNALKAGS